jgi:hypothetical protein
MKSTFILFFGITVLLSSCTTSPKENEQQAFESDLSEVTLFMTTLTNLDSGNIVKARKVAEIPVFVDLVSLPYFAEKGHPTVEQKQEMVSLARQVLDYMSQHRDEWNPELPTIQAALRGIRKILTEPDDVHKLQELSDYFDKKSQASKP